MFAKYLYFAQAHALVAVAVVVAHIPASALRVIVAASLVAGSAWMVTDYHSWRREAATRGGLPELLGVWQAERGEGEVLVFCNPMFYATARVYLGDSAPMFIQGERSDYPFFVGTAITRPDDYGKVENWTNRTGVGAFWVCDFGMATNYLRPVQVPEGWALAGETSSREFNGLFYLRLYKKVVN